MDEADRLFVSLSQRFPGLRDHQKEILPIQGIQPAQDQEETVSGYVSVDARRHPAQSQQGDNGPFMKLQVPMLDCKLMEFAENVPIKYLITDQSTKFNFRKVAKAIFPKGAVHQEEAGLSHATSGYSCISSVNIGSSITCPNRSGWASS